MLALKPAPDAMQLACASSANVDLFVTNDERVLARASTAGSLSTPAPCKGRQNRPPRSTQLARDRPQFAVAHIKGFTYYVSMNITLSIDDDLVKEVRKIAVERDTTLTGLVRSYLQQLAAEHAKSGRKRREVEALERSFEQLQIRMGKRTWKREDLYERS